MKLYEKLLYLDIETAGKYENLNEFKYKDSRGAELFIKRCEKNKKKWPEISCEELYTQKSPLLAEYGQIVCISFAYFQDGKLKKATFSDNEAQIVKKTVDILTNIDKFNLTYICGYNIKRFDIPWLIKKFFQYGYKIPKCLDPNKKPWELNIYDFADMWKNSAIDYCTLDEVSYALNIESPKKILSGDKVHYAYWRGDIDLISRYCEADVQCLIDIAKKIMDE